MADYEAIGSAIAARYSGATAPSGEPAIALSTEEPPNQVGFTPAVLVWAGAEEFEWPPGSTRVSHCEVVVQFLLSQDGDLAARKVRLDRWRGKLIDRVVGQIQLGLTYVDWCELRTCDAVTVDYGGTSYDALLLTHTVRIREQVTAAA